ncbi:MAG: F0F1 ATP synthase subunit B [candidate division Zixibacteria bacterium]|nr:F0F1 ATP synthase subunit B [candidate division Zixibacteria bacterium]MDH3937240.1 F0F1 ATP synthase subunit B [candidate division Zixibacteria bacterium]MDH4033966.1 F0F1 ATP synthase subunit B [candidate division Zixibacteria bacterium]
MDIQIIPELPQLLTHAAGFLITFWVLKKYAWGPLLKLMEDRRNKIEQEFKDIELEQEKVAQLAAEYETKLKEIDSISRDALVEAVDEGKKMAKEIEAEARVEALAMSEKAQVDLERDVAKAKVQLKNDMVNMTITAAEKIINVKLDDAKHRELIGGFLDNVEKV